MHLDLGSLNETRKCFRKPTAELGFVMRPARGFQTRLCGVIQGPLGQRPQSLGSGGPTDLNRDSFFVSAAGTSASESRIQADDCGCEVKCVRAEWKVCACVCVYVCVCVCADHTFLQSCFVLGRETRTKRGLLPSVGPFIQLPDAATGPSGPQVIYQDAGSSVRERGNMLTVTPWGGGASRGMFPCTAVARSQ